MSAERRLWEKAERGDGKGRRLSVGFLWRESPRDEKAQESRRSRPGLNIPGARRGNRLFRGEQDAEAPMRGREVSRESARAEGEVETPFRPLERKKALKSEAQERWRLREAFEGRGS